MRLNHKKKWEKQIERVSSCRVAQQQYLFSRPANTDKIYITSLLLLKIHTYFGGSFFIIPFISGKKIFVVVPAHYSGFGGCILFWVRTANKTVEAIWSEDGGFMHIFFMERIHVFPTYRGIILLCYQWQ